MPPVDDAVLDTNVIIRFITGDDPAKQQAAGELFQRVRAGETILRLPSAVVAEVVFVLRAPNMYAKTRDEVRELLWPILSLPAIRVENRSVALQALDLFATLNIHFVDAWAAALALTTDLPLYSYDRGLDRVPDLVRVEP